MTHRASRRALRLALTLTSALVVSLVMVVTGPPAHAQWPPAAPTSQDYCGTKWDRFMVPVDKAGEVDYYVGNQVVPQGQWQPTGGRSHIDIVARLYSGETQTFPLDFTTEPDSSCVEAPNQYRIEVGDCFPDGSRRVTAYFTNTADSTSWPVPRIGVASARSDGLVSTDIPKTADVPDGQTVALLPKSDNRMGLVGKKGTTWKLDFVEPTDGGTILGTVHTVHASVPSCGTDDDPSNLGQPAAQVLKVTAKKVVVRLVNKGVASATPFQVVAKPKGRKAVKVARTVAKGDSMVVRIKVKKAVKVKVKAKGKVVAKSRF